MVKTVPVSVEDGRDTDLILGLEDPLEKGMATQFSIFACRIPLTEEPSGLHVVAKSRTQLKQLSTHAQMLGIPYKIWGYLY